MPRIKINVPAEFRFTTFIPIRITDINYGGHAGNDTILSIIHEARMQFLHSSGFSEMDFGGNGMIMSDVGIEFKNEVFYGETITASVAISDIGKVGFDIIYKLEKEVEGQRKLVALAKTGMVCYNYTLKKIVAVPKEIEKLTTVKI